MGDVGDDVVWVFDADRRSDEGGRDAGGRLLFRIDLAMRRRAWMDRQAARIADIGGVRPIKANKPFADFGSAASPVSAAASKSPGNAIGSISGLETERP